MITNKLALTFDVDWAPDWAIEDCLNICLKHNIPCTVFVTHSSSILKDLLSDPRIEVGIHPNFLEGSSHGSKTEEVLDFCFDLVPDATVMRTHNLVQTTQLFGTIADNYRKIEIDCSIFLPNHTGLRPVNMYYGITSRRITRIPYFWEDDHYAVDPDCNWDGSFKKPETIGYKVFDFHPIHVVSNMCSLESYSRLKKIKDVINFSRKDIESIYNHQSGCKTFFERLISENLTGKFYTMSELVSNYNLKQHE